MRRLHLILVVAVMLSRGADVQSGTACLRYEPDTVRLTGRLERHMYYGAPGYGEDPRHDDKEVGFYLGLTSPLCVSQGKFDAPKSGVRRVQLVLDSIGYARLRPFLGRRVTLRGTLFAAYTGHHHTPVLLWVVKPVPVEHSP